MKDQTVQIGKVIKVTRKTYDVIVNQQVVTCLVRGKLASDDSEYSSVRAGDDVKIRLVSENEGVIEEILPRRSRLSRNIESRQYKEHIIATNIDQILIIMSTKNPKFKSGLLDRYIVIAEKNRLKASVCINKIDLAHKTDFEAYQKYYESLGYTTFFTSALTCEGIDRLKSELTGQVTVLVGHSGVGKSSLIVAVEPDLDIKVQEISDYTGKGQHTTTSVQLFPLSFGGFVADTPGVRELGLWDIYKKDLQQYFIELPRYAQDCQFADCRHIQEPGCAVKEAVADGKIFPERYENYLNIYASLKAVHYE